MRRFQYAIIPVSIFIMGGVFLYASGSLERITYNPVNSSLSDMRDVSPDEISVRNNATFAVRLPAEMSFAGEPVPMDVMDVRERLDRELLVNTFWHSSTILMLKRANRWFPTIERILRENDIPEDFKYLAMAESGLDNVSSPAGAKGYWQFMPATAKEYGLVINSEIDERYHVEIATQAACKFLRKLHKELGSWTMAAAAYNMGMNGLENQAERQKQSNYYDLLLNDETSRYVFRILALKAIHSSPEDFGFMLEDTDMYLEHPYKELIVDTSISDWTDFCAQNNITYRELKLLNPWLRETQLTNPTGKEYRIKVMEK